MASFLHSREGETQGDPLDMVAYVIGVLPLIKHLKYAYPDITQPWYADDAGAIGTLYNIGLYFSSLKRFVPGREYHPKPSKSIMIVHPYNLTSRKEFGLRHRFKVFMEASYLGGFIGGDESKHDWLKYRTPKWEKTFI